MIDWPRTFLITPITSYLSTGVPTVSEGTPLQEATQKLRDSQGVVFITDSEGHLKGLITKEDGSKAAELPKTAKASDLGTMKDRVVAISDKAQVWQLLKIMNGDNRPGPRSIRILCCSVTVSSPPIPEPMNTPTSSRFTRSSSNPESRSACHPAYTPNCE